ncbi:MAG: right-handed parallel beta-helix repeat-containing protein [Chitinophagaceae bacterium]
MIKGSSYLSAIVLVFLFLSCRHSDSGNTEPVSHGHQYYIAEAGNDDSDGSINNPWKSIDKLNKIQLTAGDTVYFEAGKTFAGHVLIDSSDTGADKNPIVITSFGNGRAVIDGGNGTALTVYNTKWIDVRNLVFNGAGRKAGNTKDGVIINKCSNVFIDSIAIKGFQKCGLLINSSSNVDIKRVYATENGSAGILATGEWGKRDCSNIHISYCKAENNPGDPTNFTNHSGNGILVGLCKNVLIEYCSATNNGWDMPRKGNGPVGIWCYEADSVIIQHCISYKNKTAEGAADGGGFDLDGGVTNSIIQYCLSYENAGSAFGIFQYDGASNWNNNTIRYCISENDGSVSAAHAGAFVWNSSRDTNQFRNCFFYNNTIYNKKGAAISYEPMSENAGFRFYNNLFIGKDSLIIGKETNSTYLGNNWFSLEDGFNVGGVKNFTEWANRFNKEKIDGKIVGFNIDPLFAEPGATTITNPEDLDSFNAYQLPQNSILRNGGLDLKKLFGIDTGEKSFNGSTAPAKGIGAIF